MNTCKTCKWWTHYEGVTSLSEAGFNRCANPSLSRQDRSWKTGQLASDNLEIVTGNPTRGYICTGPDFGCIHHESKIPASKRVDEV